MLNALQAVIQLSGSVTVETVKEAGLTSKETVQNLDDFWRLVFLCKRQNGRKNDRRV